MKAIITKVEESTDGILNVTVSFKEADKEIKSENYSVADSPSAIKNFKEETLLEAIRELKKEKKKGTYLIKEGEVIKDNTINAI